MLWIRYLGYFAGIALLCWGLTELEVWAPGSLKIETLDTASALHGAMELSPVQVIEVIVLAACAVLMVWVARYYPSQQALAVVFCAIALAFLLRESAAYLDRYLIHKLWQTLVVVIAAVTIAHSFRHRRRLLIALGRIWPSPGLVMLFCGAVLVFAFASFAGREALWLAILGDQHLGDQRGGQHAEPVALAVGEIIRLAGYLFWLAGSIDYALQSRAIEVREPLPASVKRRHRRTGQRRF